MIKQLSENTAEQLCAQQVITSLPDCIKQLIDNSIDAKATFIKTILHEYGKVRVEVIDNGMGIDSFDFLGKKGSTSKNKGNDRFDYLGFRGQAIHSIGRVSRDMSIESKCVRDGLRRKFNVVSMSCEQFRQERICHGEFNFQIANREGSRNTGTRVVIQNLFQRLPVRHIELREKCKDFLRKTNQLIKEYCLIYPEIQFMLINTIEGREEMIIETVAHKRFDHQSWLLRIKEMDERIGASLVYIKGDLFEGFVLGKVESGSSRQNSFIHKNFHYLFVNRRPVEVLPAVLSALNEIYRKYNNKTKYAFVINIKLEHQQIDVNLTPNKREVLIRKGMLESIVEGLKREIAKKVVEEMPTLSNFQEQQDRKSNNNGVGFKSQPAVIEEMSKVDPLNPRKTIFFPMNKSLSSQQGEKAHQQRQSERFTPNDKGEHNRKDIFSKSAKASYQLPQLPKPPIDRNKLKEQLNSRMGVNFSGIRRTTSQIAKPAAPNPSVEGSVVDGKQLQQILKRKQSERVRQQEQDARRRVQFMQEMKQVKVEQDELRKVKMSTVSSQREPKPKDNLMEQEIQRRREADDGEYFRQPVREVRDADEDEMDGPLPNIPKAKGNHDVELQQRIKSKINIDMSQIFNKFNKSKNCQNDQQPVEKTRDQYHLQLNKPAVQSINQKVQAKQVELQVQNKQNRDNLAGEQIDQSKNSVYGQLGDLAPKNVRKQHFRYFSIIGQFNMGFIICSFNGKFYMVDQHAADQKFQYQRNLSKSVRPDCINCFEEREITPIQNDQIEDAKLLLTDAGFFYTIIDRQILKLQRCPFFNQKKLGMQFFNLIVAEKKELQRIQKFTAICAMKACREAIKVGDSLSREQMKTEVGNLAGLGSPWNCPHGRPTLIELGSIEGFKSGIKVAKQYVL